MSKRIHHIPKIPQEFLQLLAEMIIVARKAKHWRQIDLAERVGISRQTVGRIETGDPNVAIGHYVTAAWVVDIPIFPGIESNISESQQIITHLIQFLRQQLPKRITKHEQKPINDAF